MPKKSGLITSPGGWEKGTGSMAARSIDFIQKYLVLPDVDGQPSMVLHPYQQELIEDWCDPSTKCHITVIGAGNAKTTTLAAFIVSHLFLTMEASVPVVAATVSQAWATTLGTAKRFVMTSPRLEERAEILEGQGSRSGIYVPYLSGHAFAIADKVDGLQGLKPSLAVLEEMSVASMDTFAALQVRMGKRQGAKLIGISTPSFMDDNALVTIQRAERSGNHIPNVKLKEYISDAKDYRDEAGWYAANPALLTTPPLLDIEGLRTAASILPEQMFRAYHLCQNPTGSQSCWLNSLDEKQEETGDAYDIWKRGAIPHQFKEGALTWAGVDVAKSRDHAAVVWGQFLEDGRLHAKCRIWTPTKEHDIDLESIADHLRKLKQDYDLQEVWYDPAYFWNAPLLDREGLPMVEVPQTDARMAPIIGHAYEAIRRTRITHDDDTQFTQEVLHARRKYCAQGFTLNKDPRQFAKKIDAAIALCLMHGAATGFGEPVLDLDAAINQLYGRTSS